MKHEVFIKRIDYAKSYFEIVLDNIKPDNLTVCSGKIELKKIKGYQKQDEIRYRIFYSTFMGEIIKKTKVFDFFLNLNGDTVRLKYHNKSQKVNHFSNNREVYQCWNVLGIEYLRIKVKQAKIIRNISKIDVKGELLKLTCDVALTYSEQTDYSIVLVERSTGKKRYLPVNETREKNSFTELYSNKNTKYKSTERSMRLNFGTLNLNSGIHDFFVEVKKNQGFIYRKLGFVDYIYKKDRVLSTINNQFKTYYLTLTPRGNLKIEVNIPLKENNRLEYKENSSLPVWLVGERPDTAQDTGFAFFEFLMKNKLKEVTPIYVIERGAEDEKKLLNYKNNYVYKNSEEHYELAMNASAFIGSHDLDYILPFKVTQNLSATRFFLQHGVMGRKPAEYHKKFYDYPFHGVTVSSKDEKKLLENVFGYDDKEVIVTGLSRFDKLPLNQELNDKKILVMPTWREWINPLTKFEKTEYFIRWSSL